MCNEIDHVKSVVDKYKISAEGSHLFDKSGVVEIDERLVFIAMPFEPHDEMNALHNTIRAAVLDYDASLTPMRADDIAGDSVIYDTITSHIRRCNVFIATVHGANSNVYFELGYARALHKKVVTIAGSPQDLKFDIKIANCIVETDNSRIRSRLGDWLRTTF